jgi:serine/threonine protein kinase
VTLAQGQKLLDRYLVAELLGQGGNGRVWKGRDERTSKPVTIKELGGDEQHLEAMRAWFRRELKALMALDHPGILRLIDHGEDQGWPFVITEFLDGEDLGQLVGRRGAMPVAAGVAVALQSLQALESAHNAGIVHRDIKPANLMLCRGGRVVLLDFGLARALEGTTEGTLATGLNTKVIGTPRYLSPEQLKGVSLSPLSDLYSLGATLYYVFAGAELYRQTDALSVIRAIVDGTRPKVADAPQRLPGDLCQALEHLLAHLPAQRPASASAALREFRRVAEGLGYVEGALQSYQDDEDDGVTRLTPRPSMRPSPDTKIVSPRQPAAALPAEKTTVARVPATTKAPTTHKVAPISRSNAVIATVSLILVALLVSVILVLRDPGQAPPLATELVEVKPNPAPVRTNAPVTRPPEPPAAEPPVADMGRVDFVLAQGAEIVIDGKSYGRKEIAFSIDLSAGEHDLLFRRRDLGERRQKITVKKQDDLSVRVEF